MVDESINLTIKKKAANNIISPAIKRWVEIWDKNLEVNRERYYNKYWDFFNFWKIKNENYPQILKNLKEAKKQILLDDKLFIILDLVAKLSIKILIDGFNKEDGLINETKLKLEKINKDLSKNKELDQRIQSYEVIQIKNQNNDKEFPLIEYLKDYINKNDEAALKEIIIKLVKLKYSFKEVQEVFNQLNIKSIN